MNPRHRRSTKRVLNIPCLIGTVVALAVLCPAAYFWHAYQATRTAEAFLLRADHFDTAGRPEMAATYLHRYLKLHPDNTEVRIRLAETYDRSATSAQRKQRAVELYFQAVGLAPDNVKLRRRLTELLLEGGRFAAADEQARACLRLQPDDVPALRFQAMAIYAQSRAGGLVPVEKAVQAFQKVLEHEPGDLETAVVLATLYRQEYRDIPAAEAQKLADQIMDRLITARQNDADAYLARYRYRNLHKLPGGEQDLQAALKISPNSHLVLLAAAERAQLAGDWPTAEGYFARAMQSQPERPECYLGLGDAQHQLGNSQAALATWKQGLERCGDQTSQLESRLIQLYVELKDVESAEKLLTKYEADTRRRLPQLAGFERTSALHMVDYLRASIEMGRGNVQVAVPLLKQLVVLNHGPSWQLLGKAYLQQRQWDLAANAYERAAMLQPHAIEPRLQAAFARSSMGRHDAAIRYYEQALALREDSETWKSLARSRFEDQALQLVRDQNWAPFQEALQRARMLALKKPLKEPWELAELEAAFLVISDRKRGREQAIQVLATAEKQNPDAAPMWRDLILIYERLGDRAKAEAAWSRFETLAGNEPDRYLVHAQWHVQRRDLAAARKILQAGMGQLEPEKQIDLRRALSQVAIMDRQWGEAKQLLISLYTPADPNLEVLEQLASLAVESHDWESATKWEEEFRRCEGQDSSRAVLYQARRLLAQTGTVRDARSRQAADLVAKLEQERPLWPATQVLRAELAERDQLSDKAIMAYQMAIKYGDRSPRVFERLIDLLYKQGRFAEAQAYLTGMSRDVPMSPNLSSLAITVAARRGQWDAALEQAREGVLKRPTDPLARIWLGQVLMVSEQTVEAEKEFNQAVNLGPGDIKSWAGLLFFYIESQRQSSALQTLEKLAASTDLGPAEKAFALAQGYELLHVYDKAADQYEQALKLSPQNFFVMMRVANFYAETQPARAEAALRAALQQNPNSAPAKRMLAVVLSNKEGEDAWLEAVKLLTPNDPQQKVQAADMRLLAVLFSRRGRPEDMRQARQILERLVEDSIHSRPSDRLMLGRLFAAEGLLQNSREQFLKLVTQPNPQPAYLVEYVDLLLTNNLPREAEEWLIRLEAVAPGQIETLALRSRWQQYAAGNIKVDETAFVERSLGTLEKANRPSALTGQDYRNVDLHPPAPEFRRNALDRPPSPSEQFVVSLVAQKKLDEAVNFCREAARTETTSRPAILLALALTSEHAEKRHYDVGEETIQVSLTKFTTDPHLLFAIGNLRAKQERISDAISLYEKVLKLKPTYVLALNNLAMLLSETDARREEALGHIDMAITLAGPQPPLVDTKSMILLQAGEAARAVPLLETITNLEVPDSRYFFHLAIAYQQVGDNAKSESAMTKAREGRIFSRVLTPAEKKFLAELQ